MSAVVLSFNVEMMDLLVAAAGALESAGVGLELICYPEHGLINLYVCNYF